MAFVAPTDLKIIIEGRDRCWVAEALIDLAIKTEADAAILRRGSPGRRRHLDNAGRLRDLSRRIMP